MNENANRRLWRSPVAVIIFLLILQASASPGARASDRFRVGIYDNNPLVFMDADGRPQGIFVDILEAVALRNDLEFEYVHGAFSDGLARLENGTIDVMAAIAFSEGRAQRYDYTYATVMTNWGELYTTGGNAIESILDLEGQRIGVKHGDIHFEALRRLTSEFGISCRFIEGDGFDMVFEMLAEGYVNLGVANHFFGRQNKTQYKVTATPVIFNPIDVKYAVSKGTHADLLYVIDSELARLKETAGSAYHRSLERWMMAASKPAIPRWFIYLGLFSVLVLAVLLGGNLLLRHRVRLRTRELSRANARLEAEIGVRQAKEEELRQTEKVVAASSDAMALLDPQGIVLTANAAFLAMLGRSHAVVIGRSASDLYEPEFLESVLNPQLAACLAGQVVHCQTPWPHAGTEVPIEAELTCSPYVGPEGRLNAVALNIRDVTEKQKLATQLKQAQKMEAIGTLAGGVAHDLNNILSGLVGYPDILLMDLPADSPHRQAVEVIKSSGERAAAIVQDLLTLARRGVNQLQPVDFNAIVREYLESPEDRHIRQLHPKVSYHVDLAPRPLMLMASKVHLSKSIMNLVANAAEAMPDGGKLQLTTRFDPAPMHAGVSEEINAQGYLYFEVRDTGTGIAPQDRERIFEPFYTRKVMGRSGTGLGMAVVWGAVSDHNGQIQVDSEVGEGTSFKIQLPLSGEALSVEAPPQEAMPTGNGERLLVVDDELEQRQLAMELLSRIGYSVSVAASGEAALEKLSGQDVDLVVLDMIMPGGMDGLDTFQAIRALKPDQKAILVSGYSESERVKAAQLLGAGAYLRKPYTKEKLAAAIRTGLRNRPASASI